MTVQKYINRVSGYQQWASRYFKYGNYHELRTFLSLKMSVRNQLTDYELEEFFRSLQDFLVLSLNASLSFDSFLRLRKVLSETRRFLAMAAQRNPAPLRRVLPTNLLKYRASGGLEHLISQHPLWRLKVVLPPLRTKRNKISPRNVAFVD